jgi:hypothetical protein
MKSKYHKSTQITQMEQMSADFPVICVNLSNLRHLRAKNHHK